MLNKLLGLDSTSRCTRKGHSRHSTNYQNLHNNTDIHHSNRKILRSLLTRPDVTNYTQRCWVDLHLDAA